MQKGKVLSLPIFIVNVETLIMKKGTDNTLKIDVTMAEYTYICMLVSITMVKYIQAYYSHNSRQNIAL